MLERSHNLPTHSHLSAKRFYPPAARGGRGTDLDKEGLRLTLRKHPVRLEMRIEVPTFTVL
eukprot:13642410-Ditylum_brightwellii.AAC.1